MIRIRETTVIYRERPALFLESSILVLLIIFLTGCSSFISEEQEIVTTDDLLSKGDLYFGEGEFQEALDHYLAAAEIEPENPVFFYKAGLVYGTLHSLEGANRGLLRGRENRLSRMLYRDDSHFNNAVYYFEKAAGMGHHPSREILRTMEQNIQHRDVKY